MWYEAMCNKLFYLLAPTYPPQILSRQLPPSAFPWCLALVAEILSPVLLSFSYQFPEGYHPLNLKYTTVLGKLTTKICKIWCKTRDLMSWISDSTSDLWQHLFPMSMIFGHICSEHSFNVFDSGSAGWLVTVSRKYSFNLIAREKVLALFRLKLCSIVTNHPPWNAE